MRRRADQTGVGSSGRPTTATLNGKPTRTQLSDPLDRLDDIPAGLPGSADRAARRVLADRWFVAAIERAVLAVVRSRTPLAAVRVSLAR